MNAYRKSDLMIQARMNVNYHEGKERYYSHWLDTTMFFTILLSSTAVADALFTQGNAWWGSYWIAISAAIIATLNVAMVAFKVQHLAMTHNILKRRWIECTRLLSKAEEDDDEALSEVEDMTHRIGEDEPPPDMKKLIKAQHEVEYAMGLRESPA